MLWGYHHFTHGTENYDLMTYGSGKMVHDRQTDSWTDKQMNRQMKWHITVGAPPKNNVKVIQILWSQIILIAVLITDGLEIT